MKILELNEELFGEWVAERPKVIQEMCSNFPPDRLYILKKTGQRGVIHSYSEDRTVTMDFTNHFNSPFFDERRVFGIDINDIEECDMPELNRSSETN